MTAFRSLTRGLALSALIAAAAPSWADDDLIRLDILDGGVTKDGAHIAGIRLTMAPGWKTYWRSPGDAGIPPVFSWKGSRNLDAAAVNWPTPKMFDQSGMRSIGYTDSVILPVELTPQNDGEAIRLRGSVDLGVCKHVCVPERLKFDAVLDPAAPRNPAIAAAMAARPYSEREAGVQAARCALSPTEDGLRIEVRITMPSTGGEEATVIEPGNPKIWASQPETRRSDGVLIASSDLVHADGAPIALDRSKVRVTVLGQSHAVDIQGCKSG